MVTDLFEADQRHVWHPFTQHAWWPTDDPLVISRADGVWLYDDQGRKYIDGFSSLWVTVHGHNEPAINEAIARQARTLDHSTFLGFTHEPGVRLAEQLVARTPQPLSRVFFAGDGSSAVEAGIKMAYQAKLQQGEQRPLYVHVAEGYHGDTLGAVSVGGIDLFHHTYAPILLRTRMVSSPGMREPGQSPRNAPRRCSTNCGTCWPRSAIRCVRSSSNRWSRPLAACSPTTCRSCRVCAS